MKLGTISFEIRGVHKKRMVLPSAQRRELIAHVVSTHGPDLLLCAGFSVSTNTDLDKLARDNRISTGKTAIIMEVHFAKSVRKPRELSSHEVYLIGPNKQVQSLGRQVASESDQLVGKERERRIGLFEKLIPKKSALIRGRKLFTLCCGEINVLRGRIAVDAHFAAAKHVLLNTDIVVNPTHDLMGNAGTLIAKRKWLSKPVKGRNRVYISASNWNTRGRMGRRQSPESRTLHTVYLSGKEQSMTCFPNLEQGYMYRECEIAL